MWLNCVNNTTIIILLTPFEENIKIPGILTRVILIILFYNESNINNSPKNF